MGPTLKLARQAFWDAINPHSGVKRVDEAFIGPHDPSRGLYGLIKNRNENEMSLDLVNGSMVHFVGSDNYRSLLGSPPVGLVFSEYAHADPMAWNLLRPILAENGGWAIFVTTPTGENHAATLYRSAASNPNWFAELLPATNTNVFTKETLEDELREYIEQNGEDQGRSLFNQEYMVSFAAGMVGAYYAREMEKAEHEGRIGNIPVDPRVPVHTAWDLGIHDTMVCICLQLIGKEIRVVDLIHQSDVGLDWFARELQKKSYLWGSHNFPHDIAVRELSSGRSRLEVLASLGIKGRVIPAKSVPDGINAVRTLLPSMWFDKERCKTLISALQQYRRTWSDTRKAYSDSPFHDWTSHYADALRTFAMAGVRNAQKREIKYPPMGIV